MPDMAYKEADIREETKKEKSELEKGRLSPFKSVITTVFISLAISLSCVTAYHYYFAPQIVAVDLRGYVKDQRDMFLANKISKEELKKNLDKLEIVITGLPENNVVLSRDAVIGNVEVIKIN